MRGWKVSQGWQGQWTSQGQGLSEPCPWRPGLRVSAACSVSDTGDQTLRRGGRTGLQKTGQGQALREFGLCQGRVSNSERVNKEIETERQWGCEGRSGKHLCPLLVDKCPTQSYCVLLSNWSTQWWVRAGCPPRQKWVFQELEIIIVWDTLKIHVWYTLYIAVL